MAINFKLGERRALAEKIPQETFDTDPMGRSWVGWDDNASLKDLFEQNRGIWRISKQRLARERYATFSLDGVVKMVAEITGTETISSPHSQHDGKTALVGHVLTEGPVYEALMALPVDNFRNPVTYVSELGPGPKVCPCGCGGQVPDQRVWLPGHDQRAVHERIAEQWGDTVRFVGWFDYTFRGGSHNE